MKIGANFGALFSKDIAIDLGTATTLLYVQGDGIVLYEPSVATYDARDKSIQAVGEEAWAMMGKNPQALAVERPLSGGVITDSYLAEEMLRRFIAKVCQKSLLKPRVMVCVPADITDVEERAVIEACQQAGARRVYIIEEPIAAAIGAGCDISLARGMLIVDIGGGTTDVAAISLGKAVISRSIKTAGDSFTWAVIEYVQKRYSLNIGEPTAEKIKKEIGCVFPRERIESISVYGTDAQSGLPRSATINSDEIREAFDSVVNQIIQAIKDTLEDTPPELLNDILEDGILLTGGGAKIYGLDKRLRLETGIKIFLAQDMDACVIKGAGIALDSVGRRNVDAAHTYYKTV